MKFCRSKEDAKKASAAPARRSYPVVISAKRFDGIKSRACQEKKWAQIAAVEEERHYRQYLKEGNDLLCSYFKENVLKQKQLAEAEDLKTKSDTPFDNETKLLQDHLRRERILRANKMLDRLKPGPRALHQALLQSDMIHQRKYHEDLNREIAKAAADQQKLDEQLCPEVLIPFTNLTEDEVVAQKKAKIQTFRNDVIRDMSERCKRREEALFNKLHEGAMERVQCQNLLDEDVKKAKELRAHKFDFARQAYRDAVKEKAERLEHERICDAIDERRNCVYQVASRNLSSRYNNHVKKMRADQIASREARAVRVCQMQQAHKDEAEQRQMVDEDRYQFEVKVDEERRQCELAELAKQRRAYQLEESKQAAEKRQREREIKRFEIARRLKNDEANKHFKITEERHVEKEKDSLRNILYDQRDDFLEQRRLELMRISRCNDDPYLEDDKKFFAQAVDVMEASREVGRPLYPIAAAADRYRVQNNLDMRPEARVVRRSKLRDYCWPGFVSKADLAYRKYEQREQCQEAMENDRHQIYCNSIKIQKMAALEKPYQPCESSCPINCFRHPIVPCTKKIEEDNDNKCDLPIPPIDTCPKEPPAIQKSAAKSKMLKVVRKVLNEAKSAPKENLNSNDLVDVVMSVPILIQVSSSAAAAPAAENPPPKMKKASRQRGSQSKQSGFGGGPLPGQDRPADIPNPKGTWGDGPLRGPPIQRAYTKRPSGFTGGPPPGQNRPAGVPNPKGTWGDGPLLPRCCPPGQLVRCPQSHANCGISGQDRLAPIPNPKGTWGTGPLPPSQQVQKSGGSPRLKLM